MAATRAGLLLFLLSVSPAKIIAWFSRGRIVPSIKVVTIIGLHYGIPLAKGNRPITLDDTAISLTEIVATIVNRYAALLLTEVVAGLGG
jgi:hypothetical protein